MHILKLLVIAVLFPFCLLLTGFITPTPHPPTDGLSEKKQPLKFQISLKTNKQLTSQIVRTQHGSLERVRLCSELAGRSLNLELENSNRPSVRNQKHKETPKKLSLIAKNGFYSLYGENLFKLSRRDLFRLEISDCLKDFTGVVQIHLPSQQKILVPGKCLRENCTSNELLWMSKDGKNKMANMRLESLACQTDLQKVTDAKEINLVLNGVIHDFQKNNSKFLLSQFQSTSSIMGLNERKELIKEHCQYPSQENFAQAQNRHHF